MIDRRTGYIRIHVCIIGKWIGIAEDVPETWHLVAGSKVEVGHDTFNLGSSVPETKTIIRAVCITIEKYSFRVGSDAAHTDWYPLPRTTTFCLSSWL